MAVTKTTESPLAPSACAPGDAHPRAVSPANRATPGGIVEAGSGRTDPPKRFAVLSLQTLLPRMAAMAQDALHGSGLMANGAGAVGVVVAADGAFLAFTCGMRPHADAWFSGDWDRGQLAANEPSTVKGPEGERLVLDRGTDVRLSGARSSPTGAKLATEPAGPTDGLFRRDDADGVLGAVALPGNAVCAVRRTAVGDFLPAGTVPC